MNVNACRGEEREQAARQPAKNPQGRRAQRHKSTGGPGEDRATNDELPGAPPLAFREVRRRYAGWLDPIEIVAPNPQLADFRPMHHVHRITRTQEHLTSDNVTDSIWIGLIRNGLALGPHRRDLGAFRRAQRRYDLR